MPLLASGQASLFARTKLRAREFGVLVVPAWIVLPMPLELKGFPWSGVKPQGAGALTHSMN